jgi:hypothetical protein
LAARLLAVRLKWLKARRSDATPVTGPSPRAERLADQEAAVRAAGVNGILAEFGGADAAEGRAEVE